VAESTDPSEPHGFSGHASLARRLCRVVPSLSTQALRMAYVRSVWIESDSSEFAWAIDAVCEWSKARDKRAQEVMLAFAALLHEPSLRCRIESLRHDAEQGKLGSLGSLLPSGEDSKKEQSRGEVDERHVPDYGYGRPLTLGERKSTARRPSRRQLDRLLADPHPSVILNLLNNSITTEDDVVRLAAKRPLRHEIMKEIARHPKWNVRRRVRLALVLNPGCPPELGIPLVELALRSELRTVMERTEIHPDIRRAALARLGEGRSDAHGDGSKKS